MRVERWAVAVVLVGALALVGTAAPGAAAHAPLPSRLPLGAFETALSGFWDARGYRTLG